ncbi:hypothetical protein [Nonomuraea sp. NPDC050786]|uniref:hypothetical protein n=1 Tax=Nonomuraea sp. NPDC050786 TaxID=3154840 RepID=UPI00340A9773
MEAFNVVLAHGGGRNAEDGAQTHLCEANRVGDGLGHLDREVDASGRRAAIGVGAMVGDLRQEWWMK